MDINQYIQNNHLKIIVKPNSPKTEVIGFDENKKALRIRVHAKPEDGEANAEIIKFFSKQLKKKVFIKSGFKSKEKLLEIL